MTAQSLDGKNHSVSMYSDISAGKDQPLSHAGFADLQRTSIELRVDFGG